MALTAASSTARQPTPPDERLAGPDVVRAVALIGVVVMNYHGYLMLVGRSGGVGESWLNRLFDPFDGPLSTRFASTFVLVAGVGVTLLTRRSSASPERISAARWRLARRGVLLYVVGLVVDEIWPGTILPYYGAMFVIAATLFTLRSRWLLAIGGAAAIAGAGVHLWRFERAVDGHSTSWISNPGTNSVRRYVFDVMVNGTHPLLPWLAFLCAGMVLGRVLGTPWWRRVTLATGAGLVFVSSTIALLVDDVGPSGDATSTDMIVSLDPNDRGLLYVASMLGTALLAYAVIDAIAVAARRPTEPLRLAGQMTLTLYLAHILVFNLLVDRLGWIEPAGLDTALVLAIAFWIGAIAAAGAWQRHVGRGPAEYVYRAFGG